MLDRADELARCGGRIRLAGTPMINHYGGRSTVELELKDFQVV
jgi:hypothetical protein